MRKSKFDRRAEKAIIKSLDAAARKYGIPEAKHGVSKWLTAQRILSSIAKEKTKLEQRLAELNRRMK